MVNGSTGSYNYRDFTYLPDSSNVANVSGSWLSGGQGKLTDGVIPANNWNAYGDLTPYVGWQSGYPTITFHFNGTVAIDSVSVTVDNSRGAGGVWLPSQIDVSMGGTTTAFGISQDSINPAPRTYTFTNLGLSGSSLDLKLYRYGPWVMLSEVQFDGPTAPIAPTILLLGSGLLGLAGWGRFRKH